MPEFDQLPPGAWARGRDHWGSVTKLSEMIPEGALIVVDRRVARLHRTLLPTLKARAPRAIVALVGGEGAKSLLALEKILIAGRELPRGGTLVAIGGGTIGDVSTVAAHLLKRGVRLIQVPTTVLAAVDSSLGGKGAIDVAARGTVIKNLAGVFHSAELCLLAPEFFETLSAAQRREGALEGWKMIVCLDRKLWRSSANRPLEELELVRHSRRIKAAVCSADPYERSGLRRVLNFGHTFGHVLESVSGFRLAHGEAVGLGMHCALDVGRALGVTSDPLASEVEDRLQTSAAAKSRKALARLLRRVSGDAVDRLLAADKKVDTAGSLMMVLLEEIGVAVARPVARDTWAPLLERWRAGVRP